MHEIADPGPLLQMQGAAFSRKDERLAGPINTALSAGEWVALTFSGAREAAIVAMMAAGIVKATSGNVFIEEFDPRIQPVHCKRVVGFVPYEITTQTFPSFERYIEYRAALWSLDSADAVAHAKTLLEQLEGMHESFAYPLAGALVADPHVLILDRPQPAHARAILAAAGPRAIFSTHLSAKDASAFA